MKVRLLEVNAPGGYRTQVGVMAFGKKLVYVAIPIGWALNSASDVPAE